MGERWHDISHQNLNATALFFFNDDNTPNGLKVKPGDRIYLLMRQKFWYCGYVSGYKDDIGIIPACYIQVENLESLYLEDSESYKLYNEISNRLKEYLTTLIRDYKNARMERYIVAYEYVLDILNDRRNLVHGTLMSEKNATKRNLVHLMDKLDDLLEMDKIVRDKNMMRLDFDHYSSIELFYLNATHREHEELYGGSIPSMLEIAGTIRDKKSISISYDDQLGMKIPNFYFEATKPNFVVEMSYQFQFAICTTDNPNQYLTDHVGFKFQNGSILNDSNGEPITKICALFYNLRASDMFRKLILISKIYRSGRIAGEKKDHEGKRLVCAGAIPLDGIINKYNSNNSNNNLLTEDFILNYYSIPNSDYGQIEEYLITKSLKSNIFQINIKIQFLYGSLSSLKSQHSLLFCPLMSLIRPAEFPEIITQECSQHRCDLYVRLIEFFIEKNVRGSKVNISVKATVHNSNGTIIPDCIYFCDDNNSCSDYQSTVSLHSNNPHFSDILRLSLNDAAMEDCHIRFLFQHLPTGSDKHPTIIGYTVFKLTNSATDTVVNDGRHNLCVLKADSSTVFDAKEYLTYEYNHASDSLVANNKLPSSRSNIKDYFIIETKLVATNITTNPNIQALLCYKKHWKIQDYDSIFEKLTYVSDPETLRFSTYMLISSINLTELISIHFTKPLTIILRILALLSDKKRTHHRNSLLRNCHEINAPQFNGKLHDCLVSQFDGYDNKNIRELIKKFLKSLPLLIHIMGLCSKATNNNENYSENDSKAHGTVGSIIFNLLLTLLEKFVDHDSRIFVLKIEMMTILPTIITESSHLLSLDQLFRLLETLFENVFDDTVTDTVIHTQQLNLMKFGEKLLCNLISCSCFSTDKEYRDRLVPFIFIRLNVFKNISGLIINYFNPLVNLVHYLETEKLYDDSGCHIALKHLILTNVYGYISNEQLYCDKSNKIAIFSVAISFFKLISCDEFIGYHKDMSNEDRLKHVRVLVKFSNYVIGDGVIPKHQFTLSVITCNVCVKLFTLSCQLLFSDNSIVFHKKTCLNILKLALKLMRYPSLQLESFLNDRRDRVTKAYGDARIVVINWLYLLWDKLGDKRCLFYDEFLNKYVQITFIDNPEIRSESLKLIGNTCEKLSDDVEALEIVANIIIDAFDVYLENNENIIDYIKHFVNVTQRLISEIYDEESRQNYIKIITKLHNSLLQLSDYSYDGKKAVGSTIIKDMCVYKNACYFKSIGRFDLFIRNIHKLVDEQIAQQCWLEAGCSIMEHANLLEWSDNLLPASNNCPSELEYQRKSRITMEAIDLISRGKEYDKCIQISKSLYHIHDSIFVDYLMVSELLHKMSSFYYNVVNDVRYEPEYFWVGFFGQQFHLSVRNKEFIHRGKNFLKLGDLIKTLKINFPYAEVSGSSKNIDDDLKNSDQQIIFCSGVAAIPECTDILSCQYASEKVKMYYLRNQVTKFSRQRPIIVTEDVKNKWVEEISFTTEFYFPGPLDWSHIVNTSYRKISPIEISITDVDKKVESLNCCSKKVETFPDIHITELCSLLNGVIDSAVNGGISKYAEAFLNDSYLTQFPQDLDKIQKLKNSLISLYNETKFGLGLHEIYADDRFYGLHFKMINMLDNMRISLESQCNVTLETFTTTLSPAQSSSDRTSEYSAYNSEQPPIKNYANTSSAKYSKPRKDSHPDFSLGFSHNNTTARNRSGSVNNTNETLDIDQSNVNTSKQKPKNTGRMRSSTNTGYGSVSKKLRKSQNPAPNDPKLLQQLFNEPIDDKTNYVGPFIMDDTDANSGKKPDETLDTVSSTDNLSNTLAVRSKNKFRFRFDKKRSRSKSVYNDDNN